MKKIVSLLLSFALLFVMTSASSLNVFAQEAQCVDDGIIAEENFYHYQTPDHSQYQLTQDQLAASTDVLIDYILDYPYLVDLYCSNNDNVDAYTKLCEIFNGLSELENRDDAASVMLSKLSTMAVSSIENDSLTSVYLQTLLTVPTYSQRLAEAEITEYLQITGDASILVVPHTTQVATNISTNFSASASTKNGFSANGFSYARSGTDGSTTSGTIVPLYTALSDFSDSEKVSVSTATAAKYGIEKLGNATSVYNCHSYAWYQSSTSNSSWIKDVTIYMLDDHSDILSKAEVGSIAVYFDSNNQPVHSAVVTNVNGDNITCQSKWGANGLFEHNIGTVPSGYTYSSTTIKVLFIRYARNHSNTIIIDNAATHTLTCKVCGWTLTEAHVENIMTGKCIVCGLDAPFMTYMNTVWVLPHCEHICQNE